MVSSQLRRFNAALFHDQGRYCNVLVCKLQRHEVEQNIWIIARFKLLLYSCAENQHAKRGLLCLIQ